MAIAYAQSTSAFPGTVSSASLAFPGANTRNGVITVGIRVSSTTVNVTSVSDANGNPYTQQFTLSSPNGGHLSFCYHAEGISSGANTVSVVLTSAVGLRWAIHEYTGLKSTNARDQVASTGQTNKNPTSPTVTNTSAPELLFGWGTNNGIATWTAGASYTIRETLSGKLASEDRIVTTSGSFNATATLSSIDSWSMGIVTFLSTVILAGTRPSLALLGV